MSGWQWKMEKGLCVGLVDPDGVDAITSVRSYGPDMLVIPHMRFDSPTVGPDVLKALNSHDKLVTACQTILKAWDKTGDSGPTDIALALANEALAEAGT